MKKYQFQLVRYIHDRVTGEFVNVGIVLYMPDEKFLKAKFINRFSRLSNFFIEVNGHHLINSLKQFDKEINIISKRIVKNDLFEKYSSIEEITNDILPTDDSSLVCSSAKSGIDINGQSAFADLYIRYIHKYNLDIDKDIHDDKFVWKKIYKKYFDTHGITSKLKECTIRTNHDVIQFDKAWKNGVWNCFQSVSFDLKRNDLIKNKVYKWSGIINELENSNDNIHLYFLTISPEKKNSINKFIEDTLNRKSKNVTVSIVTENQAEEFTSNLKKEIEIHESL